MTRGLSPHVASLYFCARFVSHTRMFGRVLLLYKHCAVTTFLFGLLLSITRKLFYRHVLELVVLDRYHRYIRYDLTVWHSMTCFITPRARGNPVRLELRFSLSPMRLRLISIDLPIMHLRCKNDYSIYTILFHQFNRNNI